MHLHAKVITLFMMFFSYQLNYNWHTKAATHVFLSQTNNDSQTFSSAFVLIICALTSTVHFLIGVLMDIVNLGSFFALGDNIRFHDLRNLNCPMHDPLTPVHVRNQTCTTPLQDNWTAFVSLPRMHFIWHCLSVSPSVRLYREVGPHPTE